MTKLQYVKIITLTIYFATGILLFFKGFVSNKRIKNDIYNRKTIIRLYRGVCFTNPILTILIYYACLINNMFFVLLINHVLLMITFFVIFYKCYFKKEEELCDEEIKECVNKIIEKGKEIGVLDDNI